MGLKNVHDAVTFYNDVCDVYNLLGCYTCSVCFYIFYRTLNARRGWKKKIDFLYSACYNIRREPYNVYGYMEYIFFLYFENKFYNYLEYEIAN